MYLQYDVTTKTRIVYETPTEFPQVTLCNLNMFTTKYGYTLLSTYYSDSKLTNLSYTAKTYVVAPTALFFLTDIISNLSDTDKKRISHSIDDILVGCKFNYQQCSSADFTWKWDKGMFVFQI